MVGTNTAVAGAHKWEGHHRYAGALDKQGVQALDWSLLSWRPTLGRWVSIMSAFENQWGLTPGKLERYRKLRYHAQRTNTKSLIPRLITEAAFWKAPGPFAKEICWLILGNILERLVSVRMLIWNKISSGRLFFALLLCWPQTGGCQYKHSNPALVFPCEPSPGGPSKVSWAQPYPASSLS